MNPDLDLGDVLQKLELIVRGLAELKRDIARLEAEKAGLVAGIKSLAVAWFPLLPYPQSVQASRQALDLIAKYEATEPEGETR